MSGFARLSSRLLPALIGALSAGAAALAEAPARVVSMNLCTDQLAMMIAAPGQLVSVTHVAADPNTSVMAEAARSFARNAGRAEEIYALQPDLVLAGVYSDPVAVGLLRRLGIEVAEFPVLTALDQIPGQVRRMGRVLGREAAAEALARGVEARLAALPAPAPPHPVAAFFHASGYSLGEGTISHDIVTRAGFENLSETLGMEGGGHLALETLIMARPDLIITGRLYPGASRSEEVASHPALDGIPRFATGPEWTCATPATLGAVEALVRLRDRLTRAGAAPGQEGGAGGD